METKEVSIRHKIEMPKGQLYQKGLCGVTGDIMVPVWDGIYRPLSMILRPVIDPIYFTLNDYIRQRDL